MTNRALLLRRMLLLGAVSLLAVPVLPGTPDAAGHTRIAREWLFYGTTFEDDNNTTGKRKDPVNWIFLGGPRDITNNRVAAHLEDDWTRGAMRDRICKESQRMKWKNFRGGRKSDKQDRHRMTNCRGRQYHTRLWDDYEHSLLTSHRRYSWVVGGLHHEKLVSKLRFVPGTLVPYRCCFGHKIDRNWDSVRRQGVKAMGRTHCKKPVWAFHPGAQRKLQGYRNSGYIARISMRHRGGGCRGA